MKYSNRIEVKINDDQFSWIKLKLADELVKTNGFTKLNASDILRQALNEYILKETEMKLRADRKEIRQKEAATRDEENAKLTPEAKLAKLDNKLGAGVGAKKERARLKKSIKDSKKKKAKPRNENTDSQ